MSATKRLLWSATGLLFTAGPGAVMADRQHGDAGQRVVRDREGSSRLRRCDDEDARRSGRAFRVHRACWARPQATTTVATVPVQSPTTSASPATSTTVAGATTTVTSAGATTPAAPTTTVAPTTTTTAPASTTTTAPVTTTTVAPTTTTTAAATTTTVAATTTTVAPTTTTSMAPAVATVEGRFANLAAGMSSRVASPDSPDRGLVAFLTVANPTSESLAVTVHITATSPAGFPKYFEAADFSGGGLTCRTVGGAEYFKASVTEAAFVCTGSLSASGVSVLTVSTGSLIPATAVGKPVVIDATLTPGAAHVALAGAFE